MVPTEDAPTTSSIPDSAKTDLGRISVLWLNGESGFRRERWGARGGHRQSNVQSPRSSGTGHKSPSPRPLPSAKRTGEGEKKSAARIAAGRQGKDPRRGGDP